MEKTRYSSIDKLKTVCAFLIVCIHAPFPGEGANYFIALFRVAVPVFFMISGFFYKKENASRQIRKLLAMFFGANLLYFFWRSFIAMIHGNFVGYLADTFTVKNLARFLFLNETHLQSHLWYLGAILYVTVIVTLLMRKNERTGKKLLFFIVPFLLAGDLILGKYSLLLFHTEFPYILVRNWIFVGIPYFSIGLWLKEKNTIIHNKLSVNGKILLIAVILLTSITTIIERWILVSCNMNSARDNYLSTAFLAVSVFLLFLLYVSPKEDLFSRIGKRDSALIYILHPIFITLLSTLISLIGAEWIYCYFQPIAVFMITALLVEGTNGIKSFFKKKHYKNKMQKEK